MIRGYIGVGIQEVTPALAKAFNIPPEKGALVSNVDPNSPGAKAGLQRGDVITEMNGKPIAGPNDLRLKVATMAPGTTVHFKVLRNGQTRDVSFKLGESPSGKNAGNTRQAPQRPAQCEEFKWRNSLTDIRQQLGIKSEYQGRSSHRASRGSPAADAGLQRGDVIEQINRQPVNSIPDYQRLIAQAGKQALVLLINRKGHTAFLVVQPEYLWLSSILMDADSGRGLC